MIFNANSHICTNNNLRRKQIFFKLLLVMRFKEIRSRPFLLGAYPSIFASYSGKRKIPLFIIPSKIFGILCTKSFTTLKCQRKKVQLHYIVLIGVIKIDHYINTRKTETVKLDNIDSTMDSMLVSTGQSIKISDYVSRN